HYCLSFLFFLLALLSPQSSTLSLHDALPISCFPIRRFAIAAAVFLLTLDSSRAERLPIRAYTTEDGLGSDSVFRIIQDSHGYLRSEEHTSELQSRGHLVCRLLLEKKKQQNKK